MAFNLCAAVGVAPRLDDAPAAAPPARRELPGAGCDAFVLIAAMNPCPCGYYDDPRRARSCAPGVISWYPLPVTTPLFRQRPGFRRSLV